MQSNETTRHELDVLGRTKLEAVLVSQEMVSYRCLVLEAVRQNARSFCIAFPPEDRLVLTRHIPGQLLRGLESFERLGSYTMVEPGSCRSSQ